MATKTFASSFDQQSGIRERLALLAQFGTDFDPSLWGYHPSRDLWYYCGPKGDVAGRNVQIRQEGSKSLELIEQRWGIDRRTAMALIGYPETR